MKVSSATLSPETEGRPSDMENSLGGNENEIQKVPEENYQHDHLGILKAAADVEKPKSWWVTSSAWVVDKLLFLIGISPFLILILLTVLVTLFPQSTALVVMAMVFWIWALVFLLFQLRLVIPATNPMLAKDQQSAQPNRVVVIGAGAVGLAVIKECLELGAEVQCFERKSGVGGVYRYDEKRPGGVWKGARLTSSPWVTAFSDFPPSSPSSEQLTHEDYLAYLEDYADRFSLKPRISFEHTVECVEPHQGGWQVRVRNDETGEVKTVQCDRVAICSGLNQIPKPLSFPGMETFKGEIRTVAQYKGSEGYEGKRVVVVGLGESGADIAHELSSIAQKALLSVYRGKFIIPRINPLTNQASDYDTNRMRNSSPLFLKDWAMSFRRSLCGYRGIHTKESAVRARLLEVSKTGPNSQTSTKSDDFIKSLLDGRLILRDELVAFDEENAVFADGSREKVDVVLLAHGYYPVFPFLKLPEKVKPKHPGHLFLRMFYPEIGDSLAFCGFTRPAIGAIPPTGELQARLFALLAAGKRVLPSTAYMKKSMAADRKADKARFPLLPEEHAIISWIPYMDKIASMIGCRPNPWKLLKDPLLLWKVATGPVTGAHYRLHGYGATAIAKKTVRELPEGLGFGELVNIFGLHFWVWPLGFVLPNRRFKSDISCL